VTALLTDAEIEKAAIRHSDKDHTPFNSDARHHFKCGARFARSLYEARLAEDAKVRAGLVASLQNLVAAICKVQDWDGTRVGSALDDVDAALDAAKEIK